jgi:hypothetical protein
MTRIVSSTYTAFEATDPPSFITSGDATVGTIRKAMPRLRPLIHFHHVNQNTHRLSKKNQNAQNNETTGEPTGNGDFRIHVFHSEQANTLLDSTIMEIISTNQKYLQLDDSWINGYKERVQSPSNDTQLPLSQAVDRRYLSLEMGHDREKLKWLSCRGP